MKLLQKPNQSLWISFLWKTKLFKKRSMAKYAHAMATIALCTNTLYVKLHITFNSDSVATVIIGNQASDAYGHE